MNPVKCTKCNLFYDGEKYTECPHCAKGGDLPKRSQPAVEKRPAASNVKKEQAGANANAKKEKTEKKSFFAGLFKKKAPKAPKAPKTAKGEPEKPAMSSSIPVQTGGQGRVSENPPQKKPSVHPEQDAPKQQDAPAAGSLEAAIKGTESVSAPGDRKTEARYNFSNSIDPVNGWLVCIKGEYKGSCFNIKEGRNNIGRSLTMDIALAKEKSVSRERHASVIFEPNNRVFYLQSGESSGLTYLNGELVLTVKELKENDVIDLGRSSFIFIGFSGENFDWEDYAG